MLSKIQKLLRNKKKKESKIHKKFKYIIHLKKGTLEKFSNMMPFYSSIPMLSPN